MEELLYTFDNGDRVIRTQRAIITYFNGRRGVLSTSPFNGGLRNDLKTVFNFDCVHFCDDPCALYAPDYAGHLRIVAHRLGLDPDVSAGLSTAVYMKNAAVVSETWQELTVTAVTTAGIDINGGRAGDPAALHEQDGQYTPVAGTINIFLFVNVNLSDTALTRAVITATEAKTAALQERLVGSGYSDGLATGSGTDGMVVVCDRTAPVTLTEAGKHYKLGELIGRVVHTSVRSGLNRHSHIHPAVQADLLSQLKRFGITEQTLYRACAPALSADAFALRLKALRQDALLSQQTALYCHLMDLAGWGFYDTRLYTVATQLLNLMQLPAALCPSPDIKTALLTAYVSGLTAKIIHLQL